MVIYCKNKRCLTCKFSLLLDTKIYSNVNSKTFVSSLSQPSSCNTKNIVYLITCSLCNIQYVGITSQTLRDRLNGHRCKIKENLLKTNIVTHFNLPNHSFSNLKIQILETVEEGFSLTERELFWIKQLQTIFPFGLNDNILGFGNVSMLGSENAPHFCSQGSRIYRSHGHRKPFRYRQLPTFLTFKDFCDLITTPNGTNKLRANLFNMNMQRLNILGNSLRFIDNTTLSYDHKRCYGIIKAVIFYRSFQNSKSSTDKSPDHIHLNLTYRNQICDQINVSSIFKSKCVTKCLPKSFSVISPTLSFSLGKPVRSKLFNYKQTIHDFTDINNLRPCNCNNSKYIYNPAGHVITGDLNFITNNKLRSIFSNGPNFRYPCKMDFKWFLTAA